MILALISDLSDFLEELLELTPLVTISHAIVSVIFSLNSGNRY